MSVNTALYGKEGDTQTKLNPETIALQVKVTAEDGSDSDVEAELIKIRQTLTSLEAGGVSFKGALTSTAGLPTVGYKAGWQYAVKEAGTYAGQTCEVGELIICINDYASGSASNSDWAVLQVNIVGAVTGPSVSVAAHVAIFDGTTGKIIKDSGFTLGCSVPANAKFTDTTYSAATASADGLLTAALYTKLVGIETGADKTDADNVAAAGAFMKSTNTADDLKDGTSKVVMTSDERSKLSSIASGAEVNQNAIAKIKVGSTTISATAESDTLELEAGEGVTITPNTSSKKVTVAETYIDSCIVDSLDNVPANLRNGGVIFLRG